MKISIFLILIICSQNMFAQKCNFSSQESHPVWDTTKTVNLKQISLFINIPLQANDSILLEKCDFCYIGTDEYWKDVFYTIYEVVDKEGDISGFFWILYNCTGEVYSYTVRLHSKTLKLNSDKFYYNQQIFNIDEDNKLDPFMKR